MEPVSDEAFPDSVLGYAIHVWYSCPKCRKEYTMAEVRDRLLKEEEALA
jgi:hypothetical protein